MLRLLKPLFQLLVPIVLNWVYAKIVKTRARAEKDAITKQRAQDISVRIRNAKTKEELDAARDELRNALQLRRDTKDTPAKP